MSYYSIKRKGIRDYSVIFEIDLDAITGFVVDALTGLAIDRGSYFTPRTTKRDLSAVLSDDPHVYRYSGQNIGWADTFPNLVSVSVTPAVLKIGEDVALSASATVALTDFETNDAFELPAAFAANRVEGSHFAKMFARN